MSKTIQPAEFEKLEGRDRMGWRANYVGYKKFKERSYEECDLGHTHYMGWVERTVPIGDPISYTWHKPTLSEEMIWYYSDKMLNDSIAYNVFDFAGTGSKTITFNRHTPLDDPTSTD